MRPSSQSLHSNMAPAWNNDQMRMAPGAAAAAAAARSAESQSNTSSSSATTTTNKSASSSSKSTASSNISLEDRIQAICRKLVFVNDIELPISHVELLELAPKERWEVLPVLWTVVNEARRLSQADRHTVGKITVHWVTSKTITTEDYRQALRQFLETLEDLMIDIPKIDQYLVELLGKLQIFTHNFFVINN